MRAVRITFCAFSLVASFLALFQHLGFNLWNCASCSRVNELPISGIIAWLGPVVLGVLVYAQYKESKWSDHFLSACSVGSLVLVGWMVTHHSICFMCVLVHIGVLSARLCFSGPARFAGPLVFSLAIAFTATSGWDRFTFAGDVAIFRPRDEEDVPSGKVYVLFTDPECSRCLMAEAKIAKMANPPHILHRWSLLPQDMYRGIRTASLLEMARRSGHARFERLRGEIQKSIPPYTDSVLLSAATKAGLFDEAKGWLEQPNERALVAIEDDRTTSDELKIKSLPALAELSSPDRTGTRTLRLVPFSTIGL